MMFKRTVAAPPTPSQFAAMRVVGNLGRSATRADVAGALKGFCLTPSTEEIWWRSRWLGGPTPESMARAGKMNELFAKTAAAVLASVEGLGRLGVDAGKVRSAREMIVSRLKGAAAPEALIQEVEILMKGVSVGN